MNEKKGQLNNEVIYKEWVPAGRFVKFTVAFVSMLIISIGIVITTFAPIDLAFMGFILGIVSLFILLMYWNYRGLKITLTADQLEVVYGLFNRKRIPLQKITDCDITKAKFKTYGGVGIRLGLDGSTAYNTDFGEAIKISFESGRPFVFSTRNPKKICSLMLKSLN